MSEIKTWIRLSDKLYWIINITDCSSVDYVIAKAILYNIKMKNMKMSGYALCDDCNVSKSSLTRFAQKLGYFGFKDLWLDAQVEMSETQCTQKHFEINDFEPMICQMCWNNTEVKYIEKIKRPNYARLMICENCYKKMKETD